MQSEHLINDTVFVSVSLASSDSYHNSLARSESKIIFELEKLYASEKNDPYILEGRAHQLMRSHPAGDDSGSSFVRNDNGGCVAKLVFERCEERSHRVHFEFTLTISADAKKAWFSVKCNPTTILAGNNVFPVWVVDPATERADEFPSSSWGAMHRMYRLGFEVLEELYQQSLGKDDSLFSASTRNAIDNGHIHIVSAQWAAYLPTKDKAALMQTMTLLLGQKIARGKGVITLAKHLGLEFNEYINLDTDNVPGIMMRKRHGKKHVFSVSLYDKFIRLGQMRQQAALSDAERDVVTNNIRLDITAHSEGIKAIVSAARKKLVHSLECDPEVFGVVSPELFFSHDARSTVWWLERAIFILSHRPANPGVARWSFATWIVPHMLRDILHLDVVNGFTTDGFEQFVKLTDKVAVAWREIETPDNENWATELGRKAGCSISTAHSRRDDWLAKHKIDISLPYAFYRDIPFFGANSFTRPADRTATIQAVWRGDGKKLMDLRAQSAREFDLKRAKRCWRNGERATEVDRPQELPRCVTRTKPSRFAPVDRDRVFRLDIASRVAAHVR